MKKITLLLTSIALVASCEQMGAPIANDMQASNIAAPTVVNNNTTPETAPKADIVDTAVAAGNFTTLAKALTAANLIETLKGEGPFTVFAPTDEAFAALPAGTLDDLLANPEALTKVLTYHVVAGNVMAEEVVKLKSAKTVEGSEVAITVTDGKVMVNGANVVTTDIKTANGTIHVIDAVLLPPTN